MLIIKCFNTVSFFRFTAYNMKNEVLHSDCFGSYNFVDAQRKKVFQGQKKQNRKENQEVDLIDKLKLY